MESIPLTISEKLTLENLQLKAQLLMLQMAILEKERDAALAEVYGSRAVNSAEWEVDLAQGVIKRKEETHGNHYHS
jgi:hypothetical protein